jgi:hypothetical protein
MGQIIQRGENRPYKVRNRSLSGFTFNFQSKLASGTGESIVNLDQVFVKATLYRAGKAIVLFTESLLVLAIESLFSTGQYDYTQNSNNQDTFIDLDGAANNKLKLVPVAISLGSPINLSGDDELVLDVNVQRAAFSSSNSTDLGVAFVTVDAVEAVGLEYFTPVIKVLAIDGGKSTVQEDLGDNVTKITFINTQTAALDLTAMQIVNYQLASDRLSINDDLQDLLSKRVMTFDSAALANARKRSFVLYDHPFGTELDKVKVDLQLNASQVTVGKNYLVYRTFLAEPSTVIKAQGKAAKHQQNMVAKING